MYVFSLPPHTTHYLQPADRALFKSLKHFWRLEGRRVTVEGGGKQLDRALFMPLFSKAWKKAATPSNAQAGFCGSGIFPLNPDKINKNLFMPSKTTERPFGETPVEPAGATPSHPPCDDNNGDDDDDRNVKKCYIFQSTLLTTLCMMLFSKQYLLHNLYSTFFCPPLSLHHLWHRKLKW